MILNYLRNGSGVEMTNPAHRGGSSIMLARLFFWDILEEGERELFFHYLNGSNLVQLLGIKPW
jgi:hypothetical protein